MACARTAGLCLGRAAAARGILASPTSTFATTCTLLPSPARVVRCQVLEKATTHLGFGRRGMADTSRRQPAAPAPRPQQQGSDAEVLRHIESVIGPLDTKPLAPEPRPLVIVISGPSGVGKDAVINRLKEQREDLYFVVTATSRPKRVGEVEGRDYFFVTKDRFEQWIAQGMLLEHALVYGEYKGIPRQQVDDALSAGTDVVLRIDVQGAATVKRLMPEVVSIFITADSEDVLVKRLVARKTEPLDKMVVRVQTARQENSHIKDFDYVVVNRDGQLDECVREVSSIIEVEKARVSRRLQQQHQQ